MGKTTLYFKIIAIAIFTSIQIHVGYSQSDTLSIRRLMEEGISNMQNNKLDKAIELFDQGREMLHKMAIQADQKNQNIIKSNELTRNAERLIQQENLQSALELLNEAIELWDQNIEALKFRGSIRLIQEQQKPNPRDRDYIGLINDYTNAIRIVDREINNAPRNSQEKVELEKEKAKILINRAYVKMQANRKAAFDSAIEDYTEAIRNDGENWDGFLGRAVAYNKVRDSRREVNDYLRAFDLMTKYEYKLTDQEWGELYLTVAYAYSDLRDKRNAFEYATRAYNLGNLDAEKVMNKNKP
jgi:tetratricopeptide (TPR) repeat protein